MSGYTGLFTDPFFGGIGSSALVPFPFPVAIVGRPYIIDTKQFERNTVPMLRAAEDSTGEPGEQTLGTEGIWKRTVADWSLGAGQALLDQDGSTRQRFDTSKGIDPWDVRRLQLMHDTEEKRDSANTNLKMLMCGVYAYIVDGTALYHTTDLAPTTPTFTDANAPVVSISSVCTDGREVFAANGTDIVRTTAGTTVTTNFSTDNADFVGYANGYLFAGVANVLNSYTSAGGAGAAVHTHFNTAFRWVDIEASPKGIFAAGNSGERGEFFYIGFDDTTGGLLPAVSAGMLNDGEFINEMAYYQGTMLLGTSRGLRLADVVSDTGIAPGPVIEDPGSVTALEPQGEFCWFSWSNFDEDSTGLGRAKLSRFTEPSVPVYASDLLAEETGTVTSVITFADKRYFSVNGKGFYGEVGSYVSSGYVYSGRITYSAYEEKVLGIVDVRHEPLYGTVEVIVITEDGNETYVGISDVQGSVSPFSEFGGSNVRGEFFVLKVILNRPADEFTTPVLTRWTVRSIVVPLQADEILVPVLLYDTMDTGIGEGEDIYFSARNEFMFLKGLESSRLIVNYQEGSETYRVTIREITVKDVRGWNDDRDFFDCTVHVRMITVGTGVGGT